MIVPKTKHHDELGRSTRHSYEANGGGVLLSPALDISCSEPTKSHYYSRYGGSGLYRLCGQPILRMTVVCSVYCTLRVSPVGYALFSPTKKADPFGRLLNVHGRGERYFRLRQKPRIPVCWTLDHRSCSRARLVTQLPGLSTDAVEGV